MYVNCVYLCQLVSEIFKVINTVYVKQYYSMENKYSFIYCLFMNIYCIVMDFSVNSNFSPGSFYDLKLTDVVQYYGL